VLSRARRALEIGCDGVISSGLEAPRLREHLGDNFLIVTPRNQARSKTGQQMIKKELTDVEGAFRNGAITSSLQADSQRRRFPKAAASEIQNRILKLFSA
jgi:orotidine-5'-phosphate decarboxylase